MFHFTCPRCGTKFSSRSAQRKFCSRRCVFAAQRAAAIERRGSCSVENCGELVHARGWCERHYNTWRRNGKPDSWHRGRPIEVRIAEKVNRRGPDECWLWTAPTHNRSSHPQLHYRGQMRLVHRLVWELEHGSLPDSSLVIRHLCGDSLCLNPAHLAVGTPADNNRDQAAWNRAARILARRHAQEFRELLQVEMVKNVGEERRNSA